MYNGLLAFLITDITCAAAKHCTTFADMRATKEEWMDMLQSHIGVHAKETINGNEIMYI